MRAAKANHMRGAAVAAIEGQIFLRECELARRGQAQKLHGAKTGCQNSASIFPRGFWAGVNEIQIFCGSSQSLDLCPGSNLSSEDRSPLSVRWKNRRCGLTAGASFRSRRFKTSRRLSLHLLIEDAICVIARPVPPARRLLRRAPLSLAGASRIGIVPERFCLM